MKLNFETFFPALKPAVVNLVNIWPGYVIKAQFANWEVLHILALILLGGTAIIMNLRLIGVGLTEEPPSEVYRNLRRWQDAGVIGIVITGLLIGWANAERLYASSAFLVKIIALFAGIILTYGASRPTAKAEGHVSGSAKVFLLVGLGLWLASLWVFVTGSLIGPGLLHVLSASVLIVFLLTEGRVRLVFIGGVVALLAGQLITTHGVPEFDLTKLDPINVGFAWAIGAWTLAAALFQMFVIDRAKGPSPATKLVGYVSILVWVTAAAAGRWIAFA
jgi:hypothetical protein